jgi:hypothetical protein
MRDAVAERADGDCMTRAHRSFVPHCCYCFHDGELVRDRNSITGAVTLWCKDVGACRKRKERQK